MISLEEAFAKFKSRQELTEREQEDVSRRHLAIRDEIAAGVRLDTTFLSGSYKRWTKTRPLKDVDIFCVLHEDESDYRSAHPRSILERFEEILTPIYGEDRVTIDRMAVVVDFGVSVNEAGETDDKVMSIEAVPAFAKDEHYEIPDDHMEDWIETNPKIHEDLALAAHEAYSKEWKPLVRMIKKWNQTSGKPVQPSFLLEVMALRLLVPPFSGGYPYELKGFFANAAEHIYDTWPDPAGLGPAVSNVMSATQKEMARNALVSAEATVTQAILLAKQGKNGEALSTWRSLLGPQFPLS